MYEKSHQPLAPRHVFLKRLFFNLVAGIFLICFAMIVGMLGYHFFEEMAWIDAFANAAMILSGMGPLTPLHSVGGKVFAGFYALFSGLFFILVVGLVFSPVVHRFFHQIHLKDSG